MSEKPVIFISCGQRSDQEKRLGEDITRLVRDLTPFEPYFAEYQNSLEGLSTNILGALNRCAGLVAILHRRGTVQPGNLVRASVLVEQEIAIAAFLQQGMGRKLHVAAFSEAGVVREGLREHLHLNSKEFTANSQVLDHLRRVLPTWKLLPLVAPRVELAIEYKAIHLAKDRHDYKLLVMLTNRSSEPVNRYVVHLEFPMGLLEQPRTNVCFIPRRSTPSTGFFRVREDAHRSELFPGDTLRVLSAEYYVDKKIFFEHPERLQETARATLYLPGADAQVVEKSLAELQVF